MTRDLGNRGALPMEEREVPVRGAKGREHA